MNDVTYQVGGSLNPDVYQALKNGEFCYVLNSRQMGKSRQCGGQKAEGRIEEGFRQIYFSLI